MAAWALACQHENMNSVWWHNRSQQRQTRVRLRPKKEFVRLEQHGTPWYYPISQTSYLCVHATLGDVGRHPGEEPDRHASLARSFMVPGSSWKDDYLTVLAPKPFPVPPYLHLIAFALHPCNSTGDPSRDTSLELEAMLYRGHTGKKNICANRRNCRVVVSYIFSIKGQIYAIKQRKGHARSFVLVKTISVVLNTSSARFWRALVCFQGRQIPTATHISDKHKRQPQSLKVECVGRKSFLWQKFVRSDPSRSETASVLGTTAPKMPQRFQNNAHRKQSNKGNLFCCCFIFSWERSRWFIRDWQRNTFDSN